MENINQTWVKIEDSNYYVSNLGNIKNNKN